MTLVRTSELGILKGISISNVASIPLAITSISGEATGATSGKIIISVNKACTIRMRFKSVGTITDKRITSNGGDFPDSFVFTVGQAGTYEYADGSNVGGSLAASTTYDVGAYAWVGPEIGTPNNDEETAIATAVDAFTTDAEGTLAAPTAITPTSISVSESAAVGQVIGNFAANGNPTTGTWSILSDVDNVAIVDSATGQVTLESALDYATSTSHSFTLQQDNGQGTTSQAITLNVLEAGAGGGGEPIGPDDYTVSTIAAFYTLVDGWTDIGGVLQVPDSESKVIRLTAASSENLDSARNFSHQITLRASGPFAAGWDNTNKKPTGSTGSDMTGSVDLTGWSNFRLYLMKMSNVSVTDSDNVVLERCQIFGTEFNGTISPLSSTGTYALKILNSSDCAVKDCHLAFGKVGICDFNGCDNLLVEGNCFDLNRHDIIKFRGQVSGTIFRGNWFSRTQAVLDGAHCDCIQSSNSQLSTGTIAEYNVSMAPTAYSGSQNLQGLFFDGASQHSNLISQDNLIVGIRVNGMVCDNRSSGTVVSLRNTVITSGDSDAGGTNINGSAWTSHDYNFVSNGSTNISGPNGLAVDVGNPKDGADFSVYTSPAYMTAVPTALNGIGVMQPGSSAVVTHWDNANPVGAYNLLKRVLVDGLHPGNIGYPVEEPFERQYNPDSLVATTGTGTYDSDGNNV